ncbi:MAG: Na+/H+ antiporter NhaA [Geminicoccaceae bacterium]
MAHAASSEPLTVTDRLLAPIQRILGQDSTTGIILIMAALIAFIWANSPWAEGYFHLKHLSSGISVGGFELVEPLELWINDFLMVIFFFVVGLEIKREFLIGELAGLKRASLPIAGAIGGMVIPALIYVAFNYGEPTVRGWGVPMATDIAFAVGVLSLVGDRVPLALRVFLLALAIVDDLGAVLVIAFFYTADLHLDALFISLGFWVLAILYGRFGHAKGLWFAVIGLFMWYYMHHSGVHATIAGVLMAMAVPLRATMNEAKVEDELSAVLDNSNDETDLKIERLTTVVDQAQSPLIRMEHALSPWVSLLIMPLFALFNAGVTVIGMEGEGSLLSLPTYGAFFGLLIGKPVGICLLVWLACVTGLADFPKGSSWLGMAAIGLLAGIGFTMALFVANLAFGGSIELDQAKIGVLSASVVAAIVGYFLLAREFSQEAVAKRAEAAA